MNGRGGGGGRSDRAGLFPRRDPESCRHLFSQRKNGGPEKKANQAKVVRRVYFTDRTLKLIGPQVDLECLNCELRKKRARGQVGIVTPQDLKEEEHQSYNDDVFCAGLR